MIFLLVGKLLIIIKPVARVCGYGSFTASRDWRTRILSGLAD